MTAHKMTLAAEKTSTHMLVAAQVRWPKMPSDDRLPLLLRQRRIVHTNCGQDCVNRQSRPSWTGSYSCYCSKVQVSCKAAFIKTE